MILRPTTLAIPIAALALFGMFASTTPAQGPAAKTASPEPAYASLEEIPASVGVRQRCKKSEGEECATRVKLRRNVTVWGVPLKAGTIASDWEEDRSGTLSRDVEYKGVWLKGGTKISMYTTWTGTLLREQTFDGRNYPAGTSVTFDSDGHVVEAPRQP